MKQTHVVTTPIRPLLALLLAPMISHGAEIAFQAGKSPDKNYTQNAVTVMSEYPRSTSRSKGDLNIGNNKGGSSMRGLLEFDISAIPAGSKIESVQLAFYQAGDPHSPAGPVNLVLHAYKDRVVEDSTCWSDTDGQIGDAVGAAKTDVKTNGWITFNSTAGLVALAQDALDSGFALALAVKMEDEGFQGRRMVLLRGNDYAADKSRPRLVVRYAKGK